MDRNGNLLHGEESILGGESNLPVGITSRNMSGPAPIGIVTDYADFLVTVYTNSLPFRLC